MSITTRPVPVHLESNTPLAIPVQLENLREQLSVQQAIADGANNFLAVVANDSQQSELRDEVEQELRGAEEAIAELEREIDRLEQALAASIPTPMSPLVPPASALANGFADGVNGNSPTSGMSSQEREEYGALRAARDLVHDMTLRLQEMEQIGERIKAMDRIVETLNENVRIKYELQLDEYMPSVVSGLSDSSDKDVRAATYRLIRHFIVDANDVSCLHSHQIHLFLIRTLARDSKHDLEKEHALRLVRRLLDFTELVDPPPRDRTKMIAILRGVVAIAEQQEEKLRLAALETLGELVIRNLSLLVACEGLRVLLQAMSDGPYDFSPVLAMTFPAIVDHPELRQWLRPGVDLEIVLSGFTEVQGKGSSAEERVKASASIVETLLKSWAGLLYLNVNGRQALTSLVDSLTNPSRIVRDTLLDMLSNIFSSRQRRTLAASQSRRQETIDPRKVQSSMEQHKTNLLDQYIAIVLLAFIDAGLIEGLAELAANPQDASTSLRVSALIGEILDLSNRVLPAPHAARLQVLPKLFALSSSFDTSDQRIKASDTLLSIAGLNREKRIVGTQRIAHEKRPRPNLMEDPSQRNLQQRQLVESDKLRVALSIDDITFRNLLLVTDVLSTKDDTKWNFDVLLELVEGPLRNPKRLDETIRASKFMRRILQFFQPLSFRYSDMRRDKTSSAWTRLGLSVINTLLAHPEGAQYLAEDKLLPQIAECLLQLEPAGVASTGADALFSKERIENTLVSGYFDILGEMTKSPAGLALLDQFKLFTCFYRISELRGREDLVKLIIEKMDYTRDGHPRVFLNKALTSSYKHVRLFATGHLATLISQSSSSSPSSRCAEWQVDLLVVQLYDPAPEVTELAVSTLHSACRSEANLAMVVKKRPEVEHLGDKAVGLLTQFLASSIGVRYLHEIDFIERELDDWFEVRNYRYMVELELSLAAALQSYNGVLPPTTFDGTPPPHFYGELVKTSEGCEILDESGHFVRFCDIIRDHAEHCLDPEYIKQLKSVLWAVGHICASENGLMFLEDEYVLADIFEIACTSPVYTLRGTAVFATSLISSTIEGVEMLGELGWESVVKPLNGPTGLCVPFDLDDLLFTPMWASPETPLPGSLELAPPTSHVDRDTLVALANLSNHILATKASKQLAKLKTRHRSHFSSPSLYYRALEMLSSHHYRQAVRKYVLELFDLEINSENASRIEVAGEDLRARKIERDENGPSTPAQSQGNGVNGFKAPSWATSGVSALMNGGGMGIEGEVTEDDDDFSSVDEAETTIPLKTLTPIVTVRGFMLA